MTGNSVIIITVIVIFFVNTTFTMTIASLLSVVPT
jgi:hypothetical protein